MTEQYACQSYYDDNNVLHNCTCNKCSSTNSHLMKIVYQLFNDNGEVVITSNYENITTAKDAGIFVQESIESNHDVTYCAGCEVLVQGHVGETIYCKKCQKYIPDDSDFSSAVDEV